MAGEVMVQAAFEGENRVGGTGCLAGGAPVGLHPLAESRSDNGAVCRLLFGESGRVLAISVWAMCG
jgi:hypothetical protein